MNHPNPRALLRALVLALPLLGLGAIWAIVHTRAQQGVEWDVPVRGYDPRDLLRGHYIVYRYDWPGLDAGPALLATARGLCLHGEPPRIERVAILEGACTHPVRATEAGSGLSNGRLYVPQSRAAELERQLANGAHRAILRFRLRPDGHLMPLRITVEPAAGTRSPQP